MNEHLESAIILERLFDRFRLVKKRMEEVVERQKRSHKTGAVYISLHYCSNKKNHCIYCPHHFEFRQRITNEENRRRGKMFISDRIASKRITHRDLWRINKDHLYPMLKDMENELRPLQEERDELAQKIRRIMIILRTFSAKNKARLAKETEDNSR